MNIFLHLCKSSLISLKMFVCINLLDIFLCNCECYFLFFSLLVYKNTKLFCMLKELSSDKAVYKKLEQNILKGEMFKIFWHSWNKTFYSTTFLNSFINLVLTVSIPNCYLEISFISPIPILACLIAFYRTSSTMLSRCDSWHPCLFSHLRVKIWN